MISRLGAQSVSLSSFCKWIDISVRRFLTNRKRACLIQRLAAIFASISENADLHWIHSRRELVFVNHAFGKTVDQPIVRTPRCLGNERSS